MKPGAKAVNAQAAVAIPVTDGAGRIFAVVGGAFTGEREIEGEELEKLQRAVASLRDELGTSPE